MLTMEKWLEERLSPFEPSKAAESQMARLVDPVKEQVSARWFSVPLASGVGKAVFFHPTNKAKERKSLVILLHALGRVSMVSEWQWVQALVAKGVPVLAVEWDGHGTGSLLWDVAQVTRSVPLILHKLYATGGNPLLSRQEECPKCFLMGNSFGATLALLAAARPEMPSVVRGVVAISPMVALAGSRADGAPRKRFRGGGKALRDSLFSMGIGVDPFDQVRAFLRESLDAKNLLQEIRVPVLWMHGARDSLVPVDLAMGRMGRISSALFAHIDESRGHKLMNASPEIANYAAKFIERCIDVESV